MREAEFYDKSENGGVICRLCPHNCHISPGKKGLCHARRNDGGVLLAESYGRVTSAALDPIEKKPMNHFMPGSYIMSLGSYGCNFHCAFCQNYSIAAGEAPWRDMTPREVADMSAALTDKGNIGVAFTYNEPLIGYEFVLDCARLIDAQKQKNVLVTNGFICREPLERLLDYVHAMNIDLKAFTPDFYKEIGGDLGDVMRTIEISARRCHVEVTTLIIPGLNDSPGEMSSLARWLADLNPDIPLHISRFFPRHKMQNLPPTPADTIYSLVGEARMHLRHVHTGNM